MSNHSRKSEAVGIGALLAAAAGAYWLWGSKDAAKHRRLAKSWMLKARAEVMDQVGKLQNLDRTQYMKIVDRAVAAAGAAAAATRPEIARLSRDLREAWNHIATHSSKTRQGLRRTTSKKRATKARPKSANK